MFIKTQLYSLSFDELFTKIIQLTENHLKAKKHIFFQIRFEDHSFQIQSLNRSEPY